MVLRILLGAVFGALFGYVLGWLIELFPASMQPSWMACESSPASMASR